jgi:glyoxylate/hydroxypyruvate reductase A
MPTDNPRILIWGNRPGEAEAVAALLAERQPELAVATASNEADFARELPLAEVLFGFRVPSAYWASARQLRWFQVMGAGLEDIAAGPALPPGVVVTNLKGVFGAAMAEYALAYMLAHAQRVRDVLAQQARGEWRDFTPGLLGGATVGVIGMGSIGREVAGRCAALGMHVLGLSRSGAPVAGIERVFAVEAIADFLPRCDYLVCVVPQTPDTTGLLNRERLRLLKPSCFLVNMGRGNVLPLADIELALRERWLAGAALDVFLEEPLPFDSPLWALDNAFITPHISGVNRPEDVLSVFMANLARYRAGDTLENVVDLARGY